MPSSKWVVRSVLISGATASRTTGSAPMAWRESVPPRTALAAASRAAGTVLPGSRGGRPHGEGHEEQHQRLEEADRSADQDGRGAIEGDHGNALDAVGEEAAEHLEEHHHDHDDGHERPRIGKDVTLAKDRCDAVAGVVGGEERDVQPGQREQAAQRAGAPAEHGVEDDQQNEQRVRAELGKRHIGCADHGHVNLPRVCAARPRQWKLLLTWMIAGPSNTMNSVGKMQPIIGSSILIGAFWPASSAR